MAVDAVSGVNGTTTTPAPSPTGEGGEKDYKQMTAKEILEAEKNGETIPPEILKWAQDNPDGDQTYMQATGGDSAAEETNDAVAYAELLDSAGMSLKEQCKIFTSISKVMEQRDLGNVTKMAPYTQQIPTDDESGDNSTNEVTTALGEITKEIKDSRKGLGGRAFFDGLKFFGALAQGVSGELDGIDDSLEAIQDVLNGTVKDAKQSKQYGEETVSLGKELKSHTKWWQFFGSRRRASKRAIEQGDLTIKMSERTNKLAQAIAKVNKVALGSTKENIDTVDEANAEVEGTEGGTEGTPEGGSTAASSSPDNGGNV